MRLRLHRPSPAHHGAGAIARGDPERSAAEELLGASHPLVVLLRQSERAFEQAVAVTAVQAAGIVFLLGGHDFGLWLTVSAAAVQVWLACRLASLRVSRRDLSLELIVEGSRGLGLACVEKECRRLRDPRTAGQLARSIEEMLKTADGPVPRAASARPLFQVRVVRHVAPELRQIALLLRAEDPPPQGLAAVERLLTGAATPLYGSEVEPLRQELRRARYLLSLNR